MNKLKAAVIGIGNMGKFHVRNYSEIPEVELVAVSDIDESIGKKIATEFKCKYYKDYKELAKKEKPDLVSVAVPTIYHKEIAIYFLQHGIHVLLEKPIAESLKSARKILAAEKKSKAKLTIGHIERFNPAVIKVKEIIDSGYLGKVNSIIVRRVGIYPLHIKDADVIIDLAVHDIDIVNYLLESLPDSIHSNAGKSITANRNDYADIFMKYGDTSVLVQVNWLTPVKIRKLNITGSKGYLEMDYITQEISLYENKYDKVANDFGELVVKFGNPKITMVDVNKEQPLKREILEFIKCIKNNKQPFVTTKQAMDALKIALKVSHSR